MKPRTQSLALILFLLISLGCNLPARVIATPTKKPTIPPQPRDEDVPPTETVTPESQPTETPPEEQQDPIGNLPYFPIGFFTSSGDRLTLTFYNLDGQPIEVFQIHDLYSNYIHVAGSYTGNIQDVPVVFHTAENNGVVRQILNGEVTTLFPGPDVVNLLGVPGQNIFLYTTVTWDGNALVSSFYIHSQHENGAGPIYTQADPNSWAMSPLAVGVQNGAVHTIWYCWTPWGIGGDIVFPPRKGLWTLDLESANFTEILFESDNVIGMSPDNSHAAYTEQNNIAEGVGAHVILYNLATSQSIQIPVLETSDRGAGFAVFSPDNQHIAWMEAAGWLMAETPNFHSRVRIANIAGAVSSDIPDSTFAGTAADPTSRWAVPVGWLDNEHLLVEVRGDDWQNPALVRVRYDGTEIAYLASGKFLGFLYP